MSNRPRLLAVTGATPWPMRGGFSLRAAHMLEALAEWWDLSLVVASDRPVETPPWAEPNAHEIHYLPRAWRWVAAPTRTARNSPLRAMVQDVIAARSPAAALLFNGAEFLAFGRSDFPPAVADRIDCATLERLRKIRVSPGALARAIQYAPYERRLVHELRATVVVGEDDARMLRRLSGSRKVTVIPNGVHVHGGPRFEAESARPTVIFSGILSYYANMDAIRHFVGAYWPHIRRRVPEARFVIAGHNPKPPVLKAASAPGVEIRTDVPSMREALQEAWVAVAPMRSGTGVKNKVLEAWAAGRPVVMTPLAANGLHLEEPLFDLIAADRAAFCDRVVELLGDTVRRHRHGEAAQRVAQTHHTWRASGEAMHRLLTTVLGQHRPGAPHRDHVTI